MQLTSLFVLRTPGLKKKKARALSPTYAFVLYTFCDPTPPRARASPSLPLSPSCVVYAIANTLYQLSKELRPKVFLAVTIIYRSISIKSPVPSFCALSVSSPHWFRRACCLSMTLLYAAISGIHLCFSLKNIICSTLKAPTLDRMLPMSRARAEREQSESRARAEREQKRFAQPGSSWPRPRGKGVRGVRDAA